MNIVCSLLIFLSSFVCATEHLKVYSFVLPPFTISDDGEIFGVAIDVVHEALQRLNLEKNIKIYPQKRAFYKTLEEPNTAFFPVSSDAIHQKTFVLIGPIIQSKMIIYSKNPQEPKLTSLKQISELKKSIAIVGNTPFHQQILDVVENDLIQDLPSEQKNIQKLINDRVDYWATTHLIAGYLQNRENAPPLYPIYEDPNPDNLYLAFNSNTSPEIINQFKMIFNQMVEDGTINKIQDSFLNRLSIWQETKF